MFKEAWGALRCYRLTQILTLNHRFRDVTSSSAVQAALRWARTASATPAHWIYMPRMSLAQGIPACSSTGGVNATSFAGHFDTYYNYNAIMNRLS
jgi:hypothetical protein